jgi:Ring finger domain
MFFSMIQIALLTLGCVSASFEALVGRFSGVLTGAVEDFTEILKSVLVENGKVSRHATGDLVDTLRAGLGADDRLAAVSHFFDRNQPEVREVVLDMLSVTNDVAIFMMKMDPRRFPDSEIFQPMRNLLFTYITRRSDIFLYDYLPADLRREDSGLFTLPLNSGVSTMASGEVILAYIPVADVPLLWSQDTSVLYASAFDREVITVASPVAQYFINLATGQVARGISPTRSILRVNYQERSISTIEFADGSHLDRMSESSQRPMAVREVTAAHGVGFAVLENWAAEILDEFQSACARGEIRATVDLARSPREAHAIEISRMLRGCTLAGILEAWERMLELNWVRRADGRWVTEFTELVCPICLGDMFLVPNYNETIRCDHTFHFHCIELLVASTRFQPAYCPMCRAVIEE